MEANRVILHLKNYQNYIKIHFKIKIKKLRKCLPAIPFPLYINLYQRVHTNMYSVPDFSSIDRTYSQFSALQGRMQYMPCQHYCTQWGQRQGDSNSSSRNQECLMEDVAFESSVITGQNCSKDSWAVYSRLVDQPKLRLG